MAYKVTQSRSPGAPTIYKAEANRLFGIDASTSDDNVSLGRACGISYFGTERSETLPAPGSMNMIRTNIGEVGKRNGVKLVDIDVEIGDVTNIATNGTYTALFDILNGTTRLVLLRPSETGYSGQVIVLESDSENFCNFCNFINDRLVAGIHPDRILDVTVGTEIKGTYISPDFYSYVRNDHIYNEGLNDWRVWMNKTIPVVYISNVPAGGSGAQNEAVNLLNPYICEQFLSDGVSKDFYLSLTVPDNVTDASTYGVYVFIKDYKASGVSASGLISYDGWGQASVICEIENNRIKVTFMLPETPPEPAVAGEDNIRIYYKRNLDDIRKGFETVAACTLVTNHGVGGYKDRVFLSGNSDKPNYVFYSEMDDYTYIADLNYLTVSDRKCKVMALSGHDTYLAVLTDGNGYLFSGNATNNTDLSNFAPDAAFSVARVFSCAEPTTRQNVAIFDNEILYLSKLGVSAMTASGILDERYTEIRSEYLNYWLLKENLEKVKMCVCKDFLAVLFDSDKMYVFDGNQYSAAASKPFSQRQFEGYVFDGVSADWMWEYNNELYLLKDGKLGRLSFECDDNSDYIDEWNGDGKIYAYWETPNIFGSDFYNKKSFAKLGVLLRKMMNGEDGKEINTAVRVWAKRNNEPWKLVRDYNGDQSIFRYDYLNYQLFNYRPDGKSYTVNKKIKLKKTFCLKLRFENNIKGMPLFLQAFGLEYTR